MSEPLEVVSLGRRAYRDVLGLQRDLRRDRLDGRLAHDILLLVEHDPVYTFGRGTRESSLPVPEAVLSARGADVVEIERGGDVTWHGPGQLVGYPILDLTHHRQDLHWYLRSLEEAVIGAVASFGITAERSTGRTGVWTMGRKIASIGVHVRQWVTLHGFALNIQPDLGWFDLIVPCGIHGVEMTSIRRELDNHDSIERLAARTASSTVASFSSVFDRVPFESERDWVATMSAANGAQEVSHGSDNRRSDLP